MKIGLTGSTGILGSNLRTFLFDKNLKCFNGKIHNYNDVYKWIKGNQFDAIIHLAAVVDTKKVIKDKKYSLNVNVGGTKNLINAINIHSRKKIWFFYASSSHVYKFQTNRITEKNETSPINYYGKTKLLAENYVKKKVNNIVPCIGRIFSFTDKKQNKSYLIPMLLTKLKNKNKSIKFKDLNHVRDFLQLNDISLAIKLLFEKKSNGIYNICSSKGINLKNLLIELNKKYKKKIIFHDNKYKTSLVGSNKKLIKIGWKPKNYDYAKYLLSLKF